MMDNDSEAFDLRNLLRYQRRKTMRFSEYVDQFIESPEKHLYTSSMLIAEAVRHFGCKIVIRGGEPVISYNIFKDIFSNGVNAVYGQEICIKRLVDVVESISKESGPNRGIVLLGPPASGKTNIIDLISLALEQYTKEESVKIYSFFYKFSDDEDPNHMVQVRSSFQHNPILLFTTILHQETGITKPRQKLFEYINRHRSLHDRIVIPTYYQNASLDKRNLDIIEALLINPRNKGKTLYDILEEYVRVEEIEFNNAQAQGISNIDSMAKLDIRVQPPGIRDESMRLLTQHLPSTVISRYHGALVSANRGLLHIHDAFADGTGESYRPLLMLLGSGRVSLESSQTSVDTVVVITTNLEDMDKFDQELTENIDVSESLSMGFGECLAEKRPLKDGLYPSVIANLDVVPNIRRQVNPSRQLASPHFDHLFDSAKQHYDTVIVDTPAILAVVDACSCAPKADCVVFVALADKTRYEEIDQALDRLNTVGVTPAGFVLNGAHGSDHQPTLIRPRTEPL